MVKIVIENLAKKELLVNDLSVPVLTMIHSHFVDWMHSCGGKGKCTTCKMIVLDGMKNLCPLSPAEIKYKSLGALAANERLACQAFLTGDLRILVPDENKLPHIHYST